MIFATPAAPARGPARSARAHLLLLLVTLTSMAALSPMRASGQMICPTSGGDSATVSTNGGDTVGAEQIILEPGDCDEPYPPPSSRTAPSVSTAPQHGELVAAAAGSAALSYTTPAYTSLDEERSLTLVYASGMAAPTVLVQVDASDGGSTEPPAKMSLRVRETSTGAWQTFTSGTNEVYFSVGSGPSRLSAQWNAAGLNSGSHLYDVVVRSYWSDGTWMESAPVPLRVLVVNERDSPYGSGWIVAGLQWVRAQPGGVYVYEGDGSARWFAYPGTCIKGTAAQEYCSYTSPAGDFSRLARSSTTGEWIRHFPDGSTVEFASNGRMVASREGPEPTRFAYDAQGRLTSVTDPAGLVTQLGYDAAGKLAWIRDPSGRTVTTRVTSGVLDRICDPVSCSFTAGYDTSRRLTFRTDRAGARWDFGYDAFGKLSQVVSPGVAIDGQGTVRPTSTFKTLEAAVLAAPGTGSMGTPAARVVPSQVRLTATDALGNVTSFAVDRFGSPTSITEPLGRTSTIQRDPHGRPTRIQAFQGDATEYTYQGARLSSVRDVASNRTTTYAWTPYYGYPSKIHPIGTYLGYPLVVNTPGEAPIRYVEPGWTPLVEQVGATRYWYDDLDNHGRPSVVYGPGGHTSYFFAATGARNVDSVRVVSGTDTVTTRFTRDGVGRVKETNSGGRQSSAVYDALNRVQSTTTGGFTTTYGYAPGGWLQTVTDPKGQRYSYARNPLGWLEAEVDPRGGTMRLTYDRLGHIVSGTNRRGQTVRYRYDALGRMLDQTSHEGAVTTYSYDPNARWMAVRNAESSDTIRTIRGSTPSVDQVTVRGGQRYTLNTRRDTVAHFSKVSTSWGYGVTHLRVPDHSGRLSELRDDRGGFTHVSRDDAENTTTYRLPTGDSIIRGLSEVRYSDPSAAAVLHRTYRYDGDKRVEFRGTSASDGEAVGYDVLGRIASSRRIEGYVQTSSTSYTFDAAGNPTHGGAVVGTGNRLESIGGYSLIYDADGNLISKQGPGYNYTFTWNSLGQLAGASGTADGGATSRTLTFGYDGMGRRVRKTVNGVVTRYVYDGNHVVAETDGAGVVKREFTYYPGVDQPHSMRTGGQAYYYVSDAQGNITGLVNGSGTLVNRYEYTPFGAPAVTSEQVANPLRFAGRELDVETGLYLNRMRYYDPQLQRFISEDPIGLAGGANPYAYAGNDPVNSADPTGLFPCASWEVWQNGRCFQNSIIVLPGVSTGGDAAGAVAAILRWLNDRRATSIDPADEAAYWAAVHAQAEAEQWEMERREGIESAVRSVRAGADLGVGFVPGVSTVHDASVLFTGYNAVTGESVGLGGRGIAFIGMVTPVSGGQIRLVGHIGESLIQRGLTYIPRVSNAKDRFHRFPKALDDVIIRDGAWAQRISDRAQWFTLQGEWGKHKGQFEIGINEANQVFHRLFRPYK